MSVKLYYALFSPPSRSVMVVLKLLNIPHELKPVELIKAEHLSAEYRRVMYIENVVVYWLLSEIIRKMDSLTIVLTSQWIFFRWILSIPFQF